MGISHDSMHKCRAIGGKRRPGERSESMSLAVGLQILSSQATRLVVKLSPAKPCMAAPFKQWYLQHYEFDIGRKKKAAAKKETPEHASLLDQHNVVELMDTSWKERTGVLYKEYPEKEGKGANAAA
uniref:Uncharacterized protein n=1 Tax=Fagus sylvatica TaxID=28930 RepID=A0A2N9IYN9_FAGSY